MVHEQSKLYSLFFAGITQYYPLRYFWYTLDLELQPKYFFRASRDRAFEAQKTCDNGGCRGGELVSRAIITALNERRSTNVDPHFKSHEVRSSHVRIDLGSLGRNNRF